MRVHTVGRCVDKGLTRGLKEKGKAQIDEGINDEAYKCTEKDG